MKRILFLFFFLPVYSEAQIIYPTGVVIDSTTFTFSNGDSLIHHLLTALSSGTSTITIDTSSSILWQVGKTIKPVFSNDTVAFSGIMTDTIHPYPHNANDFFLLKMDHVLPNFIVDIWHKYETDSFHAGGIIEFSTDTGATWMNIANCIDIGQVNFYLSTDTLTSGDAAFTGNSHGEQLSRLQVINCWFLKTTATSCMMSDNAGDGLPFYLRFRFVSDSTVDSLSGWIIDSIRIENPGCIPGSVSNINNYKSISMSPNPVQNTLTIASTNTINTITITNLLGQRIYTHNYNSENVQVDVSELSVGIYIVKVNGSAVSKFVKQ